MNDDQLAHDRHAELRTFAGAYALGQLDAVETATFEAHLETCEICQAEIGDLAPAVAAVRLMYVPAGASAQGPPPELGERIFEAVAREQRAESRRRWMSTASVAAVAAAVAAVVLVVGLALTRPEPTPVQAVPMEPVVVVVEDTSLEATANLVNHTWGVEIRMEATGFAEGARYEAFLIADDGQTFPAGEFVGVGEVVMRCNLNSALLRPDAEGFEIRDAQGQVVARSTFGPPPSV